VNFDARMSDARKVRRDTGGAKGVASVSVAGIDASDNACSSASISPINPGSLKIHLANWQWKGVAAYEKGVEKVELRGSAMVTEYFVCIVVLPVWQ
jgi:hypothetical protein